MRTRIFLVITVLIVGIGSGGFAQTGSVPSQDSPGAEMADPSRAKQDSVLGESDQMERRLRELKVRKEELSRQIANIEQSRSKGYHSAGKTGKDPEELFETAKARLVTLYKFKQMGYATFLLSARDLNTAVEAGYLMTKLLGNDQQLFLGLQARTTEARNRDAVPRLSGEKLKGLKLELSGLEQELLTVQKAKIEMLDQASRQESLSATYEAKIEEGRKILERQALSQKPGFDSATTPFSDRQGKLPYPTKGEIIGAFGPKTQVSSHTILYKGGIIIAAPRGREVRAVHAGVVMFADWLKEYGKVMIIDHGDHYYSLIAHAHQLLKKAGETVAEGEIIATVGDTGSLDGPKLYFEIRHHGKPVDPMEWLAVRKLSKE